jgi:hypothetical protein
MEDPKTIRIKIKGSRLVPESPDSATAGGTEQMKRRIALGASRTLALYSFAGWVYVALAALVEPNTLHLQLTHFAEFPHEDTFGEICFAVSIVSFFVYNLLCSPEDTVDR